MLRTKQHELVQQVEELKILLKKTSTSANIERKKNDELVCSITDLQKALSDKSALIIKLKEEFSNSQDKALQTQADLAKKVDDLKSFNKSKSNELSQLYAQSQSELKEARDESRLLLRELHLAQETLEKHLFQSRKSIELLQKHKDKQNRAKKLISKLLASNQHFQH